MAIKVYTYPAPLLIDSIILLIIPVLLSLTDLNCLYIASRIDILVAALVVVTQPSQSRAGVLERGRPKTGFRYPATTGHAMYFRVDWLNPSTSSNSLQRFENHLHGPHAFLTGREKVPPPCNSKFSRRSKGRTGLKA